MSGFLYCTSRLVIVSIGFIAYWADGWMDWALCAALALYAAFALWVEWRSYK